MATLISPGVDQLGDDYSGMGASPARSFYGDQPTRPLPSSAKELDQGRDVDDDAES